MNGYVKPHGGVVNGNVAQLVISTPCSLFKRISNFHRNVCIAENNISHLSKCDYGLRQSHIHTHTRRGQWALFSLIPSALSFIFL